MSYCSVNVQHCRGVEVAWILHKRTKALEQLRWDRDRQYFTSVTHVSINNVCAACPSLTTQFCKECAEFRVFCMQLGEKRCCRIYVGKTSACLFYSKVGKPGGF